MPNSTVELYVYSDPYLLDVLVLMPIVNFVVFHLLTVTLNDSKFDNTERKIEYSLAGRSKQSIQKMFDDTEVAGIGGTAVAAAWLRLVQHRAAAGRNLTVNLGVVHLPTAHRVAVAALHFSLIRPRTMSQMTE